MKTSKRIMDLKPLLMYFLFVLMFTCRAHSQTGCHEILVSYGVLSSTEMENFNTYSK